MLRRLLVVLAIVGLLFALSLRPAGAAAATQTTSPVVAMAGGAVVGSSTLTRTASGLSFTLETSGLEPGHAITIWWMVVNPDGSLSVLYAAGHVVDQSGTAEFGGSLQEGDTAGAIVGPGLLDAANADVYLVVRDHGPAKPDILNDQIHTFDVCNPTCTDLRISVHLAS